MANYFLRKIDLATATTTAPIVLATATKRVRQVYVLSLPAGADVSVILGRGDPIALRFAGQTVRTCPAEKEGVTILNPRAQVGVLQLLVGFETPGEMAALPDFAGTGIDPIQAYNRLAVGATVQAVNPTNLVDFQIFNPVGSGIIALISEVEIARTPESIVPATCHPQPITTGRNDTLLTGAGTGNFTTGSQWRDGRQAGAPACQLKWGTSVLGFAFVNRQEIFVVPEPGRQLPILQALAPGQGYQVEVPGGDTGSAIMSAGCTYRWQEVPT